MYTRSVRTVKGIKVEKFAHVVLTRTHSLARLSLRQMR